MRIAITATDSTQDASLDPRFGRCAWLAVYDSDSDTFEFCRNDQARDRPQGAGIQTAQRVATLKVEAVVTGHCGPNAFRVLEAAGLAVFTGAAGTVADAAAAFGNGQLTRAAAADVQGHW